MTGVESDSRSPANKPGILIIGSPDVGKRTLISRLLSVDFEDSIEHSSETFVHREWTIDTKYYSADVSVFMAHLGDGFSINAIPIHYHLAALVLVFDIKHVESFVAVQNWVDGIDIAKYDILLCVANKMDLVPDHGAHTEYKRKILKQMDSLDTSIESIEFGILEGEGRGLLGDEEEPLEDLRRSCFVWCLEHNIEFIEACASNIEFDKCLSVSGDSQGVERVLGALSAHMWPGMLLKSHLEIIKQPFLQDSSETEDSDYEVGYEVLSAEPWDDYDDDHNDDNDVGLEPCNSDRTTKHDDRINSEGVRGLENVVDIGVTTSSENDAIHFESEGLEGLMAEIGNMRENLRFMPDFQRRQMAAELAMRVATMFGGDCSDEDAGALYS